MIEDVAFAAVIWRRGKKVAPLDATVYSNEVEVEKYDGLKNRSTPLPD
jgi:hypothetical protein